MNFLLIDKPAGLTSHDVVDRVRRATGVRRVGHGGTLDPFATGLLIVGVGREATRELSSFLGCDKEYEATMILGAVSDTQDRDGKIETVAEAQLPSLEQLVTVLKSFLGRHDQIPPMYSAKKIGGKKLYELARAGQVVERQPVEITIHDIELLTYDPPRATFRVRCSAGTYVRTIAHDVGQKLDCGAYLDELRRTKIGDLKVTDAISLDNLPKTN
ncbi:tRNA pseudouridine(55) synthase TruB [Patescibacteria group bacterium]|nr:tRNA pseudouridine(55) synthase TruB [Patescibacteria group bacterium]MBU1916383.1 tRNA pseudouridine(55) synthase TruB [Patescibacteria group bacterium]